MSIFDDVRRAIALSPHSTLESLGLEPQKKIDGEWTPIKCPLCTDSGGSASITQEGFIKCHQCGVKGDVFTWFGMKEALKPYDAAVMLAERLRVVRTVPKPGRLPYRMTEDVLAQAVHDLWTTPAAGVCRDFLAERKLADDPELLSKLGIGWIEGYIVFGQRDEGGMLKERFRTYTPNSLSPWRWTGRGTGGVSLWLTERPLRDRVLMLEGEWDVLTAILRLRLEDQGWTVVTWNGGASSGPSLADVPRGWRGKDVHLCYDNDVFQGPDYDNYWTNGKTNQSKNNTLLKNLLGKVAPTLREAGCAVWIRQIPIDPRVVWGGDFRDWVNGGGTDLTALPCYRFETLPPVVPRRQELEFDDLWNDHIGEPVKTRAQVSHVYSDDIVMPTTALLQCQLGQLPVCNACQGPRRFSNGVVPLAEHQEVLMLGVVHKDLENYILKHVVKRPKACPEARIATQEGQPASLWYATRSGVSDDTRQRTLPVVSLEPPSLSGEVEISGRVYSDSSSLAFYAETVVPLDRAEVDLTRTQVDLRRFACSRATETRHIDDYLDRRWRDISRHVTRVHGRRDVHVACELLFHSVAGLAIGGKVRRGWLDVALLGDTRSGKSMTMRGLIDWLQLGAIHSAVDNISRAGLIMGSDHHNNLKPGLLTKSHRKLLVLDEFHWLVNSRKLGDDHPMSWMQSARDDGRVHGIKIYGDRILPAKVRLMTISNWARSRKRSFAWPCEHLAWLYGSPETLSRLDFGLIVDGPPSQQTFDPVESNWTVDMARALVLRAWAMEPHQVILEKPAVELAFELAESCREQLSCDRVPLFTPEEKPYSILRIATAVANMCFSYPAEDVYSCVVQPVHVNWAFEWLWHTWTLSGYDKYSSATMSNTRPETVFAIEKLLTVTLRLDDPAQAARVLDIIMGGLHPTFDAPLLGLVVDADRYRFFSSAARINLMTPGRDADRGRLVLTDVAHDVAKRLADMARSDPEGYIHRFRQLSSWSTGGSLDIKPLMLG